jgi:hypothetical protein
MNRLAQALICLTDKAARAAYDAEHGFRTPVTATSLERNNAVEPHSGSAPRSESIRIADLLLANDDEKPVGTDVTQVIDVPYEPGLDPPEPLPPAYELVEVDAEPLPPAFEIIEPQPHSGFVRRAGQEVIEARLVSRPETPWMPPSRRALFARIVAIRRLLVPWQKLKPLLGNPREPIDRPIQVLILLEAVAEVRPLLNSVSGVAGSLELPGGMVAALLQQPMSLHTIRSLLPDQRRAVASDWLRAETALVRESARLRELVRSGRPFRHHFRNASQLGRLGRWLLRTPESVLLVIVLAIAFAALIRSSSGR